MKTCLNILLLVIVFIQSLHATPLVVSDARIQNPDVTPVLGRGYSTATGGITSSCLEVQAKTVPSYNYDYSFKEINSHSSASDVLSGSLSASFGYGWISAKVAADYNSDKKKETFSHHMIGTMRMERYYSSVDEIKSKLSPDAATLVQRRDFVSFFQACGPNYIRSIRRTAEVTVIFKYESTSEKSDSDFNSALELQVKGIFGMGGGETTAEVSKKASSYTKAETLEINIKAFGLGLNAEGAASLSARSMDDFNKVMDYAFRSMQNDDVGLVKGIEVVPWVDNPQFQVAADLQSFVSGTPSLGMGGANKNPNDDGGGEKKPDNGENTDLVVGEQKYMSSVVKKFILMTNAEFIAGIDATRKHMTNLLYRFQQCLSMVSGLPKRLDNRPLKNHRRFTFDESNKAGSDHVTVADLKTVLSIEALEAKVSALNDFVEHFYSPCLSKLAGTVDSAVGGSLMTTAWHSLEECFHIGCLTPGVTWGESSEGGKYTCVPIKASDAGNEITDETLKEQFKKMELASVDSLVDEYCMPQQDDVAYAIMRQDEKNQQPAASE